jgi:hypothetical protein
MLTTKRVFIATICGLVFGFICMYFATANPNATEPLTTAVKVNIILSRALMGFTIGISALRIAWWLHGIVIGIIASLPMGVAVMDDMKIAISTIVMGIIYGFLTELIATVLFKAKSAASK